MAISSSNGMRTTAGTPRADGDGRLMDTVVITGANRGLGLELAKAFAAGGNKVVGGCRTPDAADELRTVTEHIHAVDIGDERSIADFVAAMGDDPIDVLVNNAGLTAVGLGAADGERDVLQLSPEHFMGEMRINALGPMLLARGLLPALRRSGRPRIVNISSQIGSMVVGSSMGRDVGYGASKAALNMITIKLASRLARRRCDRDHHPSRVPPHRDVRPGCRPRSR